MSGMSEPTDETQPHPTPGVIPPPPGPASAGAIPAPAPGPLTGESPSPTGASAPEPDAGPAAARGAGVPPPTPPLRADPSRPQTTWREPPWIPPAPARPRGPSTVAIVVGGIVLLVGLYYFVDRTLGIDLPAISWGDLWPVILIVIGGLILARAWDRGR
jgi:hypothetical protein